MQKLSMISLCLFLLLNCNQAKTNSATPVTEKKSESKQLTPVESVEEMFTFEDDEPGQIPSGWSQYFTGKGKRTDWRIVDDKGNKVLAQLFEARRNYHFNEIVFDGFIVKNVELTVKIKGVAGRMDQGGGFVWRFIDADNYYVVRANPLEDNVVLYKVENGRRSDLALVGKGKTYGAEVDPLGDGWNTLKLSVLDNLFTVYLNDKEIFKVRDETFANAGKIGLWTKADSVTFFDDFQVSSLKP